MSDARLYDGGAPTREMERVMRGGPRRTPEAQADIAAARGAPTAMEIAMQEVDRQIEDVGRELRESAAPPGAFEQSDAEHAAQDAAATDWVKLRNETVDQMRRHRAVGLLAQDATERAAQHADLDAALSNAAIADTPAVREMGGVTGLRAPTEVAIAGSIKASRTPGGNIALDTTHTVGGLLRSLGGPPHIEIERADLDDAIAALQALAGTPPPGDHTPVLPPGAIVLTGPEAARYRALQAAARKAQESTAAARADGAALLRLFQAFCAGLAPGKEG